MVGCLVLISWRRLNPKLGPKFRSSSSTFVIIESGCGMQTGCQYMNLFSQKWQRRLSTPSAVSLFLDRFAFLRGRSSYNKDHVRTELGVIEGTQIELVQSMNLGTGCDRGAVRTGKTYPTFNARYIDLLVEIFVGCWSSQDCGILLQSRSWN